jgi:hypothetical protein
MSQQKMKEDTGKHSLNKEELERAFSGQAPFVNRIVLTAGPVTARLSFLETHPEAGWHFRAAVTMTINDLIKTRDLINRVLSDAQVSKVEIGADKDDA